MPDPSPPLQTIANKYRLVRLIGRGGMGSVWEAVHISLGTTFAIKLIENQPEVDEEIQIRFLNEARAAARLLSRHVVRVFDHGVTESGEPYIVMELLRGEPLSNRLARVGRIPLADTAIIITQVARALTQAHNEGIVHRDLKPENIFLTREADFDGEYVKVVDFGIAKLPKSSAELAPDTRTGEVMGTPYYMSPEQARGIKSADHRADLWSLGVIAYRCVVGELPFDGNTLVDLMIRITNGESPIPSARFEGIPTSFDDWFAKSVARNPDDRFQSATDLARALADLANVPFAPEVSLRSLPVEPSAETIAAPSGSSHATSPKVYSSTLRRAATRPNRTPLLLVAIACVAVAAGVGVYYAVRTPAPIADQATSAPELTPLQSPPVSASEFLPPPPLEPPATSASASAPPRNATRPTPPKTAPVKPTANTEATPAPTDVGY